MEQLTLIESRVLLFLQLVSRYVRPSIDDLRESAELYLLKNCIIDVIVDNGVIVQLSSNEKSMFAQKLRFKWGSLGEANIQMAITITKKYRKRIKK